MFSRILRTAAALIWVSSLVACSAAQTDPPVQSPESPETQAPLSASAQPSEASSLPPASVVIFEQPPRPAGGFLLSSLDYLDKSDLKNWVYESFAFDTVRTITEVRWSGGYDPSRRGSGGPVQDFSISIYASIPIGAEPDVANLPLVQFTTRNNAGETPAGEFGGVETYNYAFTLPIPFEAAPYTPYWIQIEALQSAAPDWGLVQATNGDAQHFRRRVIAGSTNTFQMAPGDPAITLLSADLGEGNPTPGSAASWDREITLLPLPTPEIIPLNAERVQEVALVISRTGYTPIHFAVKVGIPVRVVFRQLGYVPGGNILLFRWGSKNEKYLTLDTLTDTKTLEFTPEETGSFRFNCPHYWYEGAMTVQE
jgi:hypothetical protein